MRVIPLAQQLLKRGLDEQVAIDSAKRLAEIFQVSLKVGKHELSRKLKAAEVEAKFDEFIDVFREAVARITAMGPTAIPSAAQDEPEEDDEEVTNDGIGVR